MPRWSANWHFRFGRAAAVLLLVAAATSPPAAAQTWIEFRPEGVGYSVEMPGKWDKQERDILSFLGPVKLHMAVADFGRRTFATMYATYAADAVRARSVGALLDGGREGALANVKGKLRTEVNLTLNTHPARQIIIDTPTARVLVIRYVLVGNTMIQALTAGPREIENDAVTTRFLDSLKVLTPR